MGINITRRAWTKADYQIAIVTNAVTLLASVLALAAHIKGTK